MLKKGIRSIGIDDGPFNRNKPTNVVIVGAVYRGGALFDGLLTTAVRRDGWNATDKLVGMLGRSKFLPQLHYAFLNGIAFGGFNIIDLDRFHRETGLKTVVVVRKKPNLTAVRAALANLSRADERWRLIERAGPIHPIGRLYCQLRGISIKEAEALLKLTCTRSHVPEPLRAAHLIAGGLVRGESGRRA
jgi:uncharacterized protein